MYQLESAIWQVGDEEFETGEPVGGPLCLCYITVGDPAPPRLTCLLLGSVGSGGSRGTIARQDRYHFAINTKVVFTPEKLIIPRDDAYTGKPWKYPLDPYLPMLSMAHRPAPSIPKPLIPFDFDGSSLTVAVTTPSGSVDTLGPAPLMAGQNDFERIAS